MNCQKIEEALRFRSLNMSVFPVHGPGMALPVGATPTDSGKFPLIKWAPYQQRLPTEKEIESWWQKWLSGLS